MTTQFRTVPASMFSLEQFAEIFTRSFEGYYYPGIATATILAERARAEQIDLAHSLVMLDGEQPIAQAVLGLRGERAWCGGFGVYASHRGRGISHQLLAALIKQAQDAGAREFGLEVLTRNQRAIQTYSAAGMRIQRQLLIYEWNDESEGDDTSDWPAVTLWQAAPADDAAHEAEPHTLLAHFHRLHLVPAPWQRDLASVLVRAELRGLALGEPHMPSAYIIYTSNETAARIVDLAATDVTSAEQLLQALQRRFSRLYSINEPSDSPITAAYRACHFTESDSQHEMALKLKD